MSNRRTLTYEEMLRNSRKGLAGYVDLEGRFVSEKDGYMLLCKLFSISPMVAVVPVGTNARLSRWLSLGDQISMKVILYRGKILCCKSHSIKRIENGE